MENTQEKNKIFKYLFVIFFAVFVGTGIFLLISSKSKTNPEKISTVRVEDTENSKIDFPEE
ncbi:MAG: hypothetical protein V1858_05575, partial [Candidatus Gottesmanbacteria bacterium]